MFRFGRSIVIFLFLSIFVPSVWAQQLSVADLQSKMAGQWLATIAGENRTRTLDISAVAQKGEGAYLFVAFYSFTGEKLYPVKAPEIQQSASGIQLTFYTSADSLVTATAQPDGTFTGTIRYKSGETKGIKLEKGAVSAAAASSAPKAAPAPDFLGKEDLLARVSGKEIIFARARDKERIAWSLATDGKFTARNFDRRSSDFGTWQIDDRGALCMKFNTSGAGCYFLKVAGEKPTLYTSRNANSPAYGDVESIK
jgi:hypothetical protein